MCKGNHLDLVPILSKLIFRIVTFVSRNLVQRIFWQTRRIKSVVKSHSFETGSPTILVDSINPFNLVVRRDKLLVSSVTVDPNHIRTNTPVYC